MTSIEWQFIESFFHDEFGRPMRGHRWRNKFGHLELDQLKAALYLHGEESNSAPTVKQVIDCLPKGLAKRGRPDHLHAWDELPLEQDGPNCLVWCNTCGAHHAHRCGCSRCRCSHDMMRRISKQWYECRDCDSAIRAQEEDPNVPF